MLTGTACSPPAAEPDAPPAVAPPAVALPEVQVVAGDPDVRAALFAELQPVQIANCELQRFGEPRDGGYLMCGNLLSEVGAGYSYGISGYDQWGCDISTKLGITVHQYDCFDTRQTTCPTGTLVFHAECVAGAPRVDDAGRVFAPLADQASRNGDQARRLVVKMDVEGAEWDTLASLPDADLARIDQLVIEFHQVHDPHFVAVVRRLKQHFYIANLHFNNFSCADTIAPFPAWAYEVLLVNKRLARVEPDAGRPAPSPLDAANTTIAPDCQASALPPRS